MRIKLGVKISLLVAAIILGVVGSILLIVLSGINDMIDGVTSHQSQAANNAFTSALDEFMSEAKSISEHIADTSSVQAAIASGDTDTLKNQIIDLGINVDFVTVTNATGIVLARNYSDKSGDDITNQLVISTAVRTGQGTSAIETGTQIPLAVRASAPVRDASGNMIAIVSSGYDLSKTKHVDRIKRQSDCEVTLFSQDVRLNTTLLDEKGDRAVGTKAKPEIAEQVLKNGGTYSGRVELFGIQYEVLYKPLESNGKIVGMLFSGVNIETVLAEQSSIINRIIIAAVTALILSVLIMVLLSKMTITSPLKKIGLYAARLEDGNLGVGSGHVDSIGIRSSDEVGDLARTLERTTKSLHGYISEVEVCLKNLSEGDLTRESEYPFRGDFVIMKDTYNSIVRNMNETMSGITTSAAQVAVGSKQIADGAQTLAQGSTQQSVAVEDLSSSIKEVAQKTRENADKASEAAQLADVIKDSAEKGSRQMDQMMNAVREINEASQSINKVIKVIDDIAFQTNILALNAAVEAARAGQHGKGFAVVAEEVRSLAAKSAEAAKDTGALITNSIEKAEIGARIADETAVSLSEIVTGINRSNEIVGSIAQSSGEQNSAIARINSGIHQVASVVQQNSATAEESAAASEELSSQSRVLDDMMSRFRLKDSLSAGGRAGGRPFNLPERPDTRTNGFGKY